MKLNAVKQPLSIYLPIVRHLTGDTDRAGLCQIVPAPGIFICLTILAHFESNYSPYYSNYSLILTSIVASIVLLEINGGSEHHYSSRLSGSLL